MKKIICAISIALLVGISSVSAEGVKFSKHEESKVEKCDHHKKSFESKHGLKKQKKCDKYK